MLQYECVDSDKNEHQLLVSDQTIWVYYLQVIACQLKTRLNLNFVLVGEEWESLGYQDVQSAPTQLCF